MWWQRVRGNCKRGAEMNVRLIATSQPRVDGIPNAEALIVYAARVSNPSNQGNHDTGERLLRYCIKNGHWSVFETASMTLEITTSRAIAAQILRHRSFTFQEFSQRYACASDFESVELRRQADNNRQSSSEIIESDKLKREVLEYLCDAVDNYNYLLEKGVARECARMILPLATQTTLYMTGSVRSWIHYFQQRRSDHAQKEHRQVADAAWEIFQTEFATISEVLK
jgi:thymidylate synthase (FAD)